MPKTCAACKQEPVLYLVRVLNIETGKKKWVCHTCLYFSQE